MTASFLTKKVLTVVESTCFPFGRLKLKYNTSIFDFILCLWELSFGQINHVTVMHILHIVTCLARDTTRKSIHRKRHYRKSFLHFFFFWLLRSTKSPYYAKRGSRPHFTDQDYERNQNSRSGKARHQSQEKLPDFPRLTASGDCASHAWETSSSNRMGISVSFLFSTEN